MQLLGFTGVYFKGLITNKASAWNICGVKFWIPNSSDKNIFKRLYAETFFSPPHRSRELCGVNCNWCEEQEKEKDLSANFPFYNTYFLDNTIFGNQVGTILLPKTFGSKNF